MIVDGSNLSMTRGDSESITVKITEHPFVSGDIIEMTVRKSATSDKIAFHKKVTTFTEGKAVINIEPSDTHALSFGKYTYDVQWTNSDGQVKTIIKPTKDNFIITEEATY